MKRPVKDNHRRASATPPPVAPAPPPGPRPLLHARTAGTPVGHGATETGAVRRVTARRSKPGAATRARARAKRLQNRKRINWPRVMLRVGIVVLLMECAAALAWSPRLYVRRVEVEGNVTVPTDALVTKLGVGPKANILWLGVGEMRDRVLGLPPVERAEVHRTLPGTVRLTVRERTPWVSVRDDATGTYYTLDQKLIPFRKGTFREPGLPLIVLKAGGEASASRSVVLGRRWESRELVEASRCVAWARDRGELFPLENVVVDARGKLCLNKVGGVEIRLGSGLDLERKLETLALLLARRTDLQGSRESQVAAVNLYAYDAPALLTRADRGAASADPGSAPGMQP